MVQPTKEAYAGDASNIGKKAANVVTTSAANERSVFIVVSLPWGFD